MDLQRVVITVVIIYVVYRVLRNQGIIKNHGSLNDLVVEDDNRPTTSYIESVDPEDARMLPMGNNAQGETMMEQSIPSNLYDGSQLESSRNSLQKMVQDAPPDVPEREALATEQLLPNSVNNDWNEINQGVVTSRLANKNFLFVPPRYIGVDSIATTNKNANQQLRRDIFIPKIDVGPFNNTSIDQRDSMYRLALE